MVFFSQQLPVISTTFSEINNTSVNSTLVTEIFQGAIDDKNLVTVGLRGASGAAVVIGIEAFLYSKKEGMLPKLAEAAKKAAGAAIMAAGTAALVVGGEGMIKLSEYDVCLADDKDDLALKTSLLYACQLWVSGTVINLAGNMLLSGHIWKRFQAFGIGAGSVALDSIRPTVDTAITLHHALFLTFGPAMLVDLWNMK